MTLEKATEAMHAGAIANSGNFKYRMLGLTMQRLNGWWQPLQWPLSADEIAANWTIER